MNLLTTLATLCLASSMAVSSVPVAKPLLGISPGEFTKHFNAVARQAGSELKLPAFRVQRGWHRAVPSAGISVLVKPAAGGRALDEVVVLCGAAEKCFLTICMVALTLDDDADLGVLQRFVLARLGEELGNVGLVMSDLAYVVISEESYVALVIRPYDAGDAAGNRPQAGTGPAQVLATASP
ncbi:malto-oligosyltrehalose synthase [Cupriavidus malaysiensis]|uniref:Malto-oligosyltrehalose synthase n=1 Tax=Cupriavidus malaysiensis TaxID=367825 RepID=A0ABN4TXD4_9BURK|nr:malto-oligosyltrehalose synthase [Cupriavidus malaysiensis]AOZ09546.1 malto-oligosyltrehalose synthase [Cupriavidus malaysiensis]